MGVEVHRDAAVGPDQLDDAGLAQLLELVRQRRPPRRGELEVRQPVGVLERLLDVGDDGGRQPVLPRGIVERFRVVAQVLVVQQAFDRRRPEQRSEAHLRGPLADHRDDVVGIRGRRGEAGVLEAVHAGGRPRRISSGRCECATTGLPCLWASSTTARTSSIVIWSWSISLMTSTPASAIFFTFARAVVRAVDAPAIRLGVRIGRVLDERTGHVERGAGNLAGVDAIADGDALLERSAEIARAGHAGHQQLLRGGRHDHRLELRGVGLVPVAVVGVADDHRVDVHVPEAGQHGHAFGGDDLGARGHGERADLADGGDLVAVDEDDAVLDGGAGEAVDEGAADEGFEFCGWSCGLRGEGDA